MQVTQKTMRLGKRKLAGSCIPLGDHGADRPCASDCAVSGGHLSLFRCQVSTGQGTLYPKGITLLGYNSAFQNQEIWRLYLNSILHTASGTIISLAVTMGTAFTLSHMRRQWPEAMPKGADAKNCKAAQGYEFCNRLFELERVFEKLPTEGRLR